MSTVCNHCCHRPFGGSEEINPHEWVGTCAKGVMVSGTSNSYRWPKDLDLTPRGPLKDCSLFEQKSDPPPNPPPVTRYTKVLARNII